MGEFEQAKPLIEEIKKISPGTEIIVSFFSPSGYENQKDYEFADHILYLPFDTYFRAKKFLDKVDPDIIVFVRYEFWRNHLSIAKSRNIKSYLVCAAKPNSGAFYFPVLNGFFKNTINHFSKIFTVGKTHSDFFHKVGFKNEITTASDTRFDRIIEKVESDSSLFINKDQFNKKVLILGSSWEPDEELVSKGMQDLKQNYSLIIVPHEPTEKHITLSKSYFPNSLLLSDIEDGKVSFNGENIIVDSIGKLLSLYKLADLAYVGGAFGVGVHSVTEAAGYGLPIICGPHMINSPDAIHLKSIGALKTVKNAVDLNKFLNNSSEESISEMGKKSKEYIYSNSGWSKKIAKELTSLSS